MSETKNESFNVDTNYSKDNLVKGLKLPGPHKIREKDGRKERIVTEENAECMALGAGILGTGEGRGGSLN